MKPPYEIKNVPKNIQLIMVDGEIFSIPLECFDYLNIEDRIIYGKGDNDENMKIKMNINNRTNRDILEQLEGTMSIDSVRVEYQNNVKDIKLADPIDIERYYDLPYERREEVINQDGRFDDNGNMIINIRK